MLWTKWRPLFPDGNHPEFSEGVELTPGIYVGYPTNDGVLFKAFQFPLEFGEIPQFIDLVDILPCNNWVALWQVFEQEGDVPGVATAQNAVQILLDSTQFLVLSRSMLWEPVFDCLTTIEEGPVRNVLRSWIKQPKDLLKSSTREAVDMTHRDTSRPNARAHCSASGVGVKVD